VVVAGIDWQLPLAVFSVPPRTDEAIPLATLSLPLSHAC
jgi:hypothetical protein